MCLLLHTATEDYTTISGLILTFTATVSSINIPVFITPDNITEGAEIFFSNLSNPIGRVRLSPDLANVTISDGKCI